MMFCIKKSQPLFAHQLRGRDSHEERGIGTPIQAFDPGSITISAAVIVAYSIEYQNS